MNEWGRPMFAKEVLPLSVKSRRLIYAALQKGVLFNRGTWDGCVFNKITGMKGEHSVAAYLGDDIHNVSNFIHVWDRSSRGLTRGQANGQLKKALEWVGIDERVPVISSMERVRIHTSADTKMVEELHAEIEAGVFDDLLKELEDAVSV